ncbi:hypothetical protein ES703_100778 [subsurface metagenome]
MATRKRTLRKMSPFCRKYARLLNDLESVLRRGRNLMVELAIMEFESRAMRMSLSKPQEPLPEPDDELPR